MDTPRKASVRLQFPAAIAVFVAVIALAACTTSPAPQDQVQPVVRTTSPTTPPREEVRVPGATSPGPATGHPSAATPAAQAPDQPDLWAENLIYTTRSGSNGSIWMARADGGQPIELASGIIPAEYPPQVPQGPLQFLTSSGQGFLLARVMEAGAESAAGQGPAGAQQVVLYGYRRDGTNRRELGRGYRVILLGELRSGEDILQGYQFGVPTSVVDRSLSVDGARLWFAVMSGPGGANGAYNTVTWYSWDVETGERRELLVTKLDAEPVQSLVATTADLSKALLVRTGPLGRPLSGGQMGLALLDVTSGSIRDLATVDSPQTSALPLLSPDGRKIVILGQTTVLIDVATGSKTDLQVADTEGGGFSRDGRWALLFQRDVQGLGDRVVLVDADTGATSKIPDRLFGAGFSVGPNVGTEPDLFIPGTSLAVVEGASQSKQWPIYLIDAASGKVQEIANGVVPRVRYLEHSDRIAVLMMVPSGASGESSASGAGKANEGKESDEKQAAGPYVGKLVIVDPRAPTSRVELDGEYTQLVESPEGDRLAGLIGGEGRTRVVVFDLANPTPVEVAAGAEISDLQFSPAGTSLAYTQRDSFGGAPSVHVVSLDGSKRQRIVADGALQAWLAAPGGYAVGPNDLHPTPFQPTTPVSSPLPYIAAPTPTRLPGSPTPLPPTPEVKGTVESGRLFYVGQSGKEKGALWMATADGKPAELATGSWAPEWELQEPQGVLEVLASSDGRVVLARVRAEQGQTLYAYSADGTNRREVASGLMVTLLGEYEDQMRQEVFGTSNPYTRPLVSRSPVDRSLSSDGKRLLFLESTGTRSGLYAWEVATGQRHELAAMDSTGGALRALADLTPDRSTALFVESDIPPAAAGPAEPAQTRLALVDLSTGARRGAATVAGPFGMTPRLSPDGRRILAVGEVASRNAAGELRKKVMLIDAATGAVLDLGEADGASGVFSPDGQKLYLLKGEGLYEKGSPKWSLTLVDVARGTQTPLRASFADGAAPEVVQLFVPGASPGELQMGGISNHRSGAVAYVVNPSSGAVEELARGVDIQPTYLERSGRLALFVALGQGTAEPDGHPVTVPGRLVLIDPWNLASRIELPTDIAVPLLGPASQGTVVASAAEVIESVDGKHLAVVLHDDKAPEASRSRLVAVDPGNAKQVDVATATWLVGPRFSPDGTRVAFTRWGSKAGRLESASIGVTSLDGKQSTVVENGSLQEWLP